MFSFIHNINNSKETTYDGEHNIQLSTLTDIPVNDIESMESNTESLTMVDKIQTSSTKSEYLFSETRTRIKEKLNMAFYSLR